MMIQLLGRIHTTVTLHRDISISDAEKSKSETQKNLLKETKKTDFRLLLHISEGKIGIHHLLIPLERSDMFKVVL